ncbi:MAG: aminotransferase class IV [Candidatus Aquicultor sp.]
MIVYLNGKLINKEDARISVFDGGFTHGDGLFETMRAYNGTIFALNQHLERLYGSAELLGYPNMPDKTTLAEACRSTVIANKLSDARVRLTVTNGSPGTQTPTVLITAAHYRGYDENLYRTGMSAILLNGFRTSTDITTTLKSTSYLPSVIARKKAEEAGCNEAILVNEKGSITEGSYTNAFAVTGKTILTPPVEDGLLRGITRDIVIDIATSYGYIVSQQTIQAGDIFDMDELFLTNSLIEVMPLTKLDGEKIGDGGPGKSTRHIQALYREHTLSLPHCDR